MLKLSHKAARLLWAIKYQNWTVEDWKKVVWSDECIMKIGVDSQRQRVLRQDGTALQDRNLAPSFKSGRVSIMIWACFSGERVGPCMILESGGIGSEEYEEILYDGLLSMIDDLLQPPEDVDTIVVANNNAFLFMHDNAPCHKTRDITQLLEENNIPVMKWPAQSPDLNPIENVWRDLKHRFHSRFLDLGTRPSTAAAAVAKYSAMIEELWMSVDRGLIQRLLESMPRRIAAVIAAKGGHTKY